MDRIMLTEVDCFSKKNGIVRNSKGRVTIEQKSVPGG